MENILIEFLASDGAILNGYLHRCKDKSDNVLIEIHGKTDKK